MQRILILLAALMATACTHTPDVVQGNVVTDAQLAKLAPGLEKRQVLYLLGTPLLTDPFHADRWDYFYDFKPAGEQGPRYRVTLQFDGDRLAHVNRTGDTPANAAEAAEKKGF
jgi:outer membrane protein assembly factor BamE